MTSHDESRRGARPPGADDGAEIKVYKRISRELGRSRSSYAPQSLRVARYTAVDILKRCTSYRSVSRKQTKQKKNLVYYIQSDRSCNDESYSVLLYL